MPVFFEQIIRIVTFGGIVLGIFVVLILNSRHAKKTRANLFLSILLIALSFSIAHVLFVADVLDHLSAKVYSIGDPTFYLIAPLLWFYSNELTGHSVKKSMNLLLHFLPFLVVIVLSLSLREVASEAYTDFLRSNHKLFIIFFWFSVVIQFSAYQFIVRRRWIAYQLFLDEEISNKEDVDISWLRFFMSIFLLINLFFLLSLFVTIHLEHYLWMHKITAFVFSLSVFALGYHGILQKQLFYVAPPVTAKVGLVPNEVLVKPDEELIERLMAHMHMTRPYLNPELTLSQLAKDLNMSRSQLSHLINGGVGDNFYDFINKFRVEEVKRLMVLPKVKNYSLLGIALEAGFKSKSTFNLIFKRFTGLTPGQYRRNTLSE